MNEKQLRELRTHVLDRLYEKRETAQSGAGALEMAGLAKTSGESMTQVAMLCRELVASGLADGDGSMTGYVRLSDAGVKDYEGEHPEDSLFYRLVAHFEGKGKLVRRGPDSGTTTRRASIRYGEGGAVGRLEVFTADGPQPQRLLEWTRNAANDPGYVPAVGRGGATVHRLTRWDEALAVIADLDLARGLDPT